MGVTQITTFSRNGVSDWLLQRASSIILTLYLILIVGFIVSHAPLQYDQWRELFDHTWMRLFTALSLLSLVAHAWIGIWTVLTDYIKCQCLRLTLQVLFAVGLLLCLGWGIEITWGII